jgi:transposase
LLSKNALSFGYRTDLWTTARIAEVIEREFAVRFHRAHVSRLLSALGWSCQKPERRALERDEERIAHWKRYRWPALKKKLAG